MLIVSQLFIHIYCLNYKLLFFFLGQDFKKKKRKKKSINDIKLIIKNFNLIDTKAKNKSMSVTY